MGKVNLDWKMNIIVKNKWIESQNNRKKYQKM